MTTLRDPVVEVDGIPMSALVREATEPRAVIVALHGGAVTCRYFDPPGSPAQWSLLRTGAALGFTVIALDRPGYGSSFPYADRMKSAAQRIDLAYKAIDRLLEGRSRGAGVFLMGHSMGCVLTVRMAADARGAELLGIEIAGTGWHPHPRSMPVMGAMVNGAGERVPDGAALLRDILWGPEHLYPTDAAIASIAPSAAPAYEGGEVRDWVRDLPELAAQVKVPVHYTLGDHEMVWRSGPQGLADMAGLFTASPRVVTDEQAAAGHNLSRGRSALAYHLKVLSFTEECVLDRERMEGHDKRC